MTQAANPLIRRAATSVWARLMPARRPNSTPIICGKYRNGPYCAVFWKLTRFLEPDHRIAPASPANATVCFTSG